MIGKRPSPATDYAAYFDESVYNLRPTLNETQKRAPRYCSIHNAKIKKATESLRGRKQSFGSAVLPGPHPDHYLIKHSVIKPVRLPDAKQSLQEKKRYSQQLDAVPHAVKARATIPLRYPYRIGDDWIKDNVKAARTVVTKIKPPRYVDGPTGHVDLLRPSGLVPVHCFRKTYGKVPNYVQKFQKQSHDRHTITLAAKETAQMAAGSQYEFITPERRQAVLDNLQISHGIVMKKFLGQSFALDNQTKIRDQVLLEKELVELEKEMDVVKRYKNIVVKKDNN